MSSRPRAYRRGRAQSTLHHLTLLPYCTVLPPVNFFTIPRKNVATRHTYARAERNLLRSVFPIVVSVSFETNAMYAVAHLFVYKTTRLAVEARQKIIFGESSKSTLCSESVKKFTRVYNAFYISRKSYALEKYFQYVSRKFRMKRYLLFFQ